MGTLRHGNTQNGATRAKSARQAPHARRGKLRAGERRPAAWRLRRSPSRLDDRGGRSARAARARRGRRAHRRPITIRSAGAPLLLASLAARGGAADALPTRPVADACQAAGAEDRRDSGVSRSAHRRARRGRPVVDAQRPPSPGGGEGARTEADHRAHLAGRITRLPHPRAQHREGAQPQGPQPGSGAHGAQPRQARGRQRESRSSRREFEARGAADARASSTRRRRALRAAPTARS